jgi:hypothetical protein
MILYYYSIDIVYNLMIEIININLLIIYIYYYIILYYYSIDSILYNLMIEY